MDKRAARRRAELNKHNSEIQQVLPAVFLMTDSFKTGGSERQFAALVRSIDRARFNVNLGCIQQKGPFLEGFGEVPKFDLGGSLYGLRSLGTRWRLRRHLRSLNIAIAHAFDFYTNLTLIPSARLAGVPLVIGSQRQIGDLLRPIEARVQNAFFGWCDVVVCNSRAAARGLIEHGIRESRLVVIGNGLPDACFVETEPAIPVRPGVLRVGMIARMNSRSKNHSGFLRSAARIRERYSNVEFVLVGDGPLRKELEQEVGRMGLGNSAHFLGERRDIPAVLASMDVSVMPSSSESLSNVIIESMAAGIPVVATRVGGNPELINEDRGILVTAGDDQALSNAVEQLLANPATRARMRENAKKFAQANFTLQQMTQRHEELYADLLREKVGRSKRRSYISPQPKTSKRRLGVSIIAASSRYVGGQSVQAELLMRNWRNDRAIEIKFIPIDPPFPRGLEWVERIPILRTIVRTPLYFLELWGGLKKADVAHIFSASYWSFFVAPLPALFVARLLGKKTLIHYHSGEARDHFRRFRTVVPTLKKIDTIVVPSGYLADVFREFGLTAKPIPNVVDTSQFPFRLRKPLRPHLVCTRGFHRYYGIDVVVRAFAEVKRFFPDASLDLVGGGPLESEIRNLVAQLNLRGINFAGVASHDQMGGYLDRADIFINGSRLDNMPVSILEAFAAGTPVISTAPEGMKYLIDDGRTGLLSPADDPKALAQNIIRVLRDPDLAASLARNAREQVRTYAWESVRQQWLDLYGLLAGTNAQS